jgi:23S rRNA (uridine2552-2'-O)-methyltransferase
VCDKLYLRLHEAKRDYYRLQARKKRLKSRAFFKLQQIDHRFKIISRNSIVIDFGCAPGGWLLYTSKAVGPEGLVLGIDLKPVYLSLHNVKTLVGDILSKEVSNYLEKELKKKADIFLSDISPNVSGIWDLDQSRQIDLTLHIVSLMPYLLREGGSAILKAFQGESFEYLLDNLKKKFENVKIVRPLATRAESSEVYLACKIFKT